MFSSLATIIRTRWFETIQERNLSITVFDYDIHHTFVFIASFKPTSYKTFSGAFFPPSDQSMKRRPNVALFALLVSSQVNV